MGSALVVTGAAGPSMRSGQLREGLDAPTEATSAFGRGVKPLPQIFLLSFPGSLLGRTPQSTLTVSL